MRPVSFAGGLFMSPDIALGALALEDESASASRVPAAVMPGRTTAPAPAAVTALTRSRREKSGIVRILSIGCAVPEWQGNPNGTLRNQPTTQSATLAGARAPVKAFRLMAGYLRRTTPP